MANYKIPSLLPNISAAKISVPNNAYTNPQPVIDKSFEAFNKGMQQAIKDGVVSANANKEYRRKEKEAQKILTEAQTKYLEDQYTPLMGLGDTGNNTFDKNKQNYFFSLKDKYIEIKNMMDENPDLQQEGAKSLAQINGEIEQFKTAAPIMLQQIVALKDALKLPPGTPGAISSEVPDDLQRMLLGIVDGGPEVTMVNSDGNLMLYMPPQTYEQNGETIETNGAKFNINSFLNLSSTGGDFIKTIPDYEDELKSAANSVIKMEDGKSDNPLYYTLNEVSVGDNKNAVVKEWNAQIVDPATNKPMIGGEYLDVMGYQIDNPFKGQKINGEMLAQMDMIRTGAFNSLISPSDPNDNDMSVLWADVIPDDLTNNESWNPTNKEQLSVALNWLSQQSVNEFGIEEGVLTHQNKSTPKGGSGSGGDSQQEASSLLSDIQGAMKDRDSAKNYFMNKSLGGKRIVDVDYSVFDENLELGKRPNTIELSVAVGKDEQEPITYNLDDMSSFKTLIKDLVKDQYGSDNTAEKIRSEIYRMLKDSGKKKKNKFEEFKDKK